MGLDLGLETLSADQLLELLIETSTEVARRDPYLLNMAQATITTMAQRLAMERECMREAAAAVLGACIELIRQESLAKVRELVANGSMRLLTAAQEARIVVETTLEAKIKMVDEVVAAIYVGKGPNAAKISMKAADPREPEDFDTFDKVRQDALEAERRMRDEAAVAKMRQQAAAMSALRFKPQPW